MGTPLSLRLDPEVQTRVDEIADKRGESRSMVLRRLVEEGLRMHAHPGVVFRDGPAGRRAGLAAGPDVWEVVRVLKNVDERGEEALGAAAEWLDLPVALVGVALAYYADWRKEIDAWIARVDLEAEAVERRCQRQRDALA